MHLPALIQDLALMLGIAGVISLLFRWLNQPAVLGYLIAGILVGPEVTLIPNVSDTESVKIWAELGIIFLLFVLGLEFSFKKLASVGKAVITAASVEVFAMLLIGFAAGHLMSWPIYESIFLGSILAISSTTIIVKAFDDLGVKSQHFAQLTFGILIVEDLWAILLLAVLSSFATTKQLAGGNLLLPVGKLAAFLIISIPLGLFFLPKILHRLRNLLTDESRVIVSLGICLALVYLSHLAGASTALGAFLAGAFLAETMEGERVERFFRPIRDLFAAIFFVSIGMLVNLTALKENIAPIVLITAITLIGKTFATTIGMRLAKQNQMTSLQTGLSMAQIGEFSFIIAAMGVTSGLIRESLYALAVAVSVVTTFTTPYLIRLAQQLPNRKSSNKRGIKSEAPKLWDSHLAEFEIHPDFKHTGKTLQEMALREKFGITIVSIHRGERRLTAPTRDEQLMPYDRVTVVGTDTQLKQFGEFFKTERIDHEEEIPEVYILEKMKINNTSKFINMNLRDSGIRELVNGLVLGIERGDKRILNPDSTTSILVDDTLWIYGVREKIRDLES